VHDPTGAGDTFAGGVIGYLSSSGKVNDSVLRKSIVYGSIMASFAVEDFSVNRLLAISRADINNRYAEFKKFTRF
jgi:sugar/nucleoside kinase (ribokinase family)